MVLDVISSANRSDGTSSAAESTSVSQWLQAVSHRMDTPDSTVYKEESASAEPKHPNAKILFG